MPRLLGDGRGRRAPRGSAEGAERRRPPDEQPGLVQHEQERGADDSVVGVLESLPDREYDGPNAVNEKAFNRR
jgi:hypothetical protein